VYLQQVTRAHIGHSLPKKTSFPS